MKKTTLSALAVLAVLVTTFEASRARGDEPRVVTVAARRFEFEPKEIRVARGEEVVLEVSSKDVTHGFFSRPLGFDEDLAPGKTVRIPLKTDAAGEFTVLCDHYCGSGHGNMKMTIVVQ